MSNKPRKKILLLITKSNYGGAQRHVYDLATTLPKEEYEVTVAYGGDGQLATMLKTASVRTVSIPGLVRDLSFKKEILAFKEIKKIIGREAPDILHVHSSKAGALGALSGRLSRVPRIVFTAHAWAFNEKRGLLFKIFAALMHWLTVILAHHTICVSHAVYRQMARFPFTKNRMSVVHPGIAFPSLMEKNVARQKITGLLPKLETYMEDVWIGTIAELHPVKNLRTAIDAFAALIEERKNIRYVIIGDGEEREKLTAYIHDKNLDDHVYLGGHVVDAATYLSAFDIFLLPSHSESFGYVILEAGAASLPVIASEVGGIPEIIAHEESGILIAPGAPGAEKRFCEAIKSLLDNPQKRSLLGTTLHESAQTRFSKESMLTGVMRVYDTTYPQ